MSVLTPAITPWQWSPEVLDFAVRHQVDRYLDPLLTATRQLFPTAREFRVLLEDDPEINDDWHIVFELQVPMSDVPDFVQAQHRWIDELYRICPAPLVCIFRLGLTRVRS
jgi:hypothetical protein